MAKRDHLEPPSEVLAMADGIAERLRIRAAEQRQNLTRSARLAGISRKEYTQRLVEEGIRDAWRRRGKRSPADGDFATWIEDEVTQWVRSDLSVDRRDKRIVASYDDARSYDADDETGEYEDRDGRRRRMRRLLEEFVAAASLQQFEALDLAAQFGEVTSDPALLRKAMASAMSIAPSSLRTQIERMIKKVPNARARFHRR